MTKDEAKKLRFPFPCAYFRPWEFDSPDEPGSGLRMKESTVRKYDLMRVLYGAPIHMNSGFRTRKRNTILRNRPGGHHAVKDSAHMRGYAGDPKVHNSKERYTFVNLMIKVGFRRIGIARGFVHGDDDPSKPINVIWTY